MAPDPTHAATDEQRNELYWGSDKTVEEIVREIGIGRTALYDSISPLPAGIDCPKCSSPMYFSTRKQRTAGTATCLECGQSSTIDGEAAAGEGDRSGKARSKGLRGGLIAAVPDRVAKIGGAAAIGVVVGAAAARVIRH